jgi:cytochrome c peroxidase
MIQARRLILAILLLGSLQCSLWNQLTGAGDDDDSSLVLSLLALALAGGCPPYAWNLPANFPVPTVPADNCMTAAKVELGRHLFYDKRLSQDQSMSCASCHRQEFAFADGKDRPLGITGETHPRNSQHLSNVAYHARLNWANPGVLELESQSVTPLFAQSGASTIVELGLSGEAYLELLRGDDYYAEQFPAVFGGGVDSVNEVSIRKALAAFQRTLISGGSPYDKFLNKQGSLSASALRGAVLFNGETAECFHCHGGFNFTDTSTHSGASAAEVAYHNNGIHSQADYAARLLRERGLIDLTGKSGDEGRHRAPSLRNVGLTFPYMHDGSFDCNPQDGALKLDVGGDCGADPVADMLGHIVDHYANGAALYASGAARAVHPHVDASLIRNFALSAQDRDDLVAFLLSLSDADFINNSAFSNPRPGDARFGP